MILTYDTSFGDIVKVRLFGTRFETVCYLELQPITNRCLTLLQEQNTPKGITSLVDSHQVLGKSWCSSLWDVAMAFDTATLTTQYNTLLSKGQTSDLKPCTIVSMSTQSKM
jgi:hypothetical protein